MPKSSCRAVAMGFQTLRPAVISVFILAPCRDHRILCDWSVVCHFLGESITQMLHLYPFVEYFMIIYSHLSNMSSYNTGSCFNGHATRPKLKASTIYKAYFLGPQHMVHASTSIESDPGDLPLNLSRIYLSR